MPHMGQKFNALASSSLTVRVLEESLVCNFCSFVAGVAPVAPAFVTLVKFLQLLLRPSWLATQNVRALSLKRVNCLSFVNIVNCSCLDDESYERSRWVSRRPCASLGDPFASETLLQYILAGILCSHWLDFSCILFILQILQRFVLGLSSCAKWWWWLGTFKMCRKRCGCRTAAVRFSLALTKRPISNQKFAKMGCCESSRPPYVPYSHGQGASYGASYGSYGGSYGYGQANAGYVPGGQGHIWCIFLRQNGGLGLELTSKDQRYPNIQRNPPCPGVVQGKPVTCGNAQPTAYAQPVVGYNQPAHGYQQPAYGYQPAYGQPAYSQPYGQPTGGSLDWLGLVEGVERRILTTD